MQRSSTITMTITNLTSLRLWMLFLASLAFSMSSGADGNVSASADASPVNDDANKANTVMVNMQTNMGNVTIALHPEWGPNTVANFINYVENSFYDGTIFHRVINDFMIQGGGFTADMAKKSTAAPIHNEADMGPGNTKGTLAMARTSDPHSATAQFFINTKDNAFLNHSSKSMQGWGYAVFGEVVDGMDVVERIEASRTASKNGMGDVPVETVVIEKMSLIETK